MSTMRIVFPLVLALSAPILGACADGPIALFREDRIAEQQLQYESGESAIYCYTTLAGNDCFAEPQPVPPNRFAGAYTDR